MKFSERLKDQRRDLALTQKEVAQELHVTQQTISSWENGRSYPDLDSLIKLSDLYQISLDILLKEDVGMKEEIRKQEVLKNIKPAIISLNVLNMVIVVIMFILMSFEQIDKGRLGLAGFGVFGMSARFTNCSRNRCRSFGPFESAVLFKTLVRTKNFGMISTDI
ncbi:helix-turn-helix domain-containing protein [Xylocopilactobacillus apicola]|uniref:HTH cro/C1-type domain-containing protein n=1 Tax=Xylocopilactobacillus apicola TaxID=2932184 RepID=A0AAU9D3T1_9LACO|nr:helix-turn-helix transcriptional regulator [Xylocopilactobacillus apicola]BDR58108.1 hypothetical protein XA3_05490 [Xylocopilactobacillus apicola]